MKRLKVTLTAIAIAGLCVGAIVNAEATITQFTLPVPDEPLTLETGGIVGTIDGLDNASDALEKAAAQALLDLTVNTLVNGVNTPIVQTVLGSEIMLSTAEAAYSGTLKDAFKNNTGSLKVKDYEYVLAKYDGPQAGSVLYYLGGASITLPEYPWSLWNGKDDQFALSHWTGFNYTVPEPATAIAGMLLLLPFGASAVRIMRRKA